MVHPILNNDYKNFEEFESFAETQIENFLISIYRKYGIEKEEIEKIHVGYINNEFNTQVRYIHDMILESMWEIFDGREENALADHMQKKFPEWGHYMHETTEEEEIEEEKWLKENTKQW